MDTSSRCSRYTPTLTSVLWEGGSFGSNSPLSRRLVIATVSDEAPALPTRHAAIRLARRRDTVLSWHKSNMVVSGKVLAEKR
eukprot:scaffold98728_cov33-Phaeocystis_antarctica.AAC.1